MILFIIGGILAAAGIITFIIGSKKIELNKKIELENKELEEKQINLTKDILELEFKQKKQFCRLEELNSKIKFLNEQLSNIQSQSQKSYENYCDILDLAYTSKELEFDIELKNLQENINNQFKKDKENIWKAFENYSNRLEEYYNQVEEKFDKSLENINKTIENYKEELDKIQKTYAAAREAQIREEEISQQADFYSLHLTEMEQITINILEELKPKMPTGSRPICKLIWETFFQKQATTLCNNILGNKTVCGIYKITNKNNGLCYVGQSIDVADRWKQHIKCGLGIDTPAQNKLYKAMLKDGITNFTFELLEQCDRHLLNEKERFYINLYQAYDYGYNSNTGIKNN